MGGCCGAWAWAPEDTIGLPHPSNPVVSDGWLTSRKLSHTFRELGRDCNLALVNTERDSERTHTTILIESFLTRSSNKW